MISSGSRPNEPFPVVPVGAVPFSVAHLEGAADWFIAHSQSQKPPVSVRLANAYCVAVSSSDQRYLKLLSDSGIVFPDGQPVVDIMKLTAPPSMRTSIGRVRGPSFFKKVLQNGQQGGVRHFFVGATDETLTKLVDRARHLYPDIKISGTYSPPFVPVDEEFIAGICGHVQDSGADIVWVGLGAPKQDFVATAVANELGICTAGVGAAFDFIAGTVAEAPSWVQNSRLEWAYRLVCEPRRLWKRYLYGNAKFLSVGARSLRSNRTLVAQKYGAQVT